LNKYEWKKTLISSALIIPISIFLLYVGLLILSIFHVESNSHAWNSVLFYKFNMDFISEILPLLLLPVFLLSCTLSIIYFLLDNLFSRNITEYLYLKLKDSDKFIYVKGKAVPNQIFFYYSLLFEEDGKNTDMSTDQWIEELLEENEGDDDVVMSALYNKMKGLNGKHVLKKAETLLKRWHENCYDTTMFHCAFAFPAGDRKAQRVYKQEVKKRFNEGILNVQLFLAWSGHFSKLPLKDQLESWKFVREPAKLFSCYARLPAYLGHV